MNNSDIIALFGISLCAQEVAAVNFAVTRNKESGSGTLREAIQSANITAGTNVIDL